MKPTRLIAPSILNGSKLTCGIILGLILILIITWSRPPLQVQADSPNDALLVQAEASRGFAAPGNSLPANFLVVVTDRSGAPVTDLDQSDFAIINHFGLPGQTCGFSNSIVSFGNIGSGAYQIRVGLAVAGCTWVEGDYLAQVAIMDDSRRGQAPATLSVK